MFIHKLIQQAATLEFGLNKLLPIADLLARLYIARIFFLSGLNKINDWSSTLYLFSAEYQVPLLPPTVAAVLGTAAELILPVLLLMGLMTRFAASGLFLLNLVAVLSYYHALIGSPAAIKDHIEWGIILLLLLAAPTGKFTLDWLLRACGKCRNNHG